MAQKCARIAVQLIRLNDNLGRESKMKKPILVHLDTYETSSDYMAGIAELISAIGEYKPDVDISLVSVGGRWYIRLFERSPEYQEDE